MPNVRVLGLLESLSYSCPVLWFIVQYDNAVLLDRRFYRKRGVRRVIKEGLYINSLQAAMTERRGQAAPRAARLAARTAHGTECWVIRRIGLSSARGSLIHLMESKFATISIRTDPRSPSSGAGVVWRSVARRGVAWRGAGSKSVPRSYPTISLRGAVAGARKERRGEGGRGRTRQGVVWAGLTH